MARNAPPRRPIEPALLTLADAAAYLSLPLATLKERVYRTRDIPSVSLARPGKRGPRRVRKADLDALIERGRVPALRVVDGRIAR